MKGEEGGGGKPKKQRDKKKNNYKTLLQCGFSLCQHADVFLFKLSDLETPSPDDRSLELRTCSSVTWLMLTNADKLEMLINS